jgi:putative intracellular protease/amidase
MKMRRLIRLVVGAATLFAAAAAAWLYSLPPPSHGATVPPLAPPEADALLEALRPAKREHPVIAIVGINGGTEMTDYLMPLGILRRARVADVWALAVESAPVALYPAELKIEPQATLAEFDARFPEGADYVIVPAMSRDDDPTVLNWLRQQAKNRAVIIGVCAGAKVVAASGLLDGKQATTHWYYLKEMLTKHPTIQYVPNRRIVVDQGVATTTGISASMPLSLTLIEAIAGRLKAEEVARDLGLARWDARHDSAAFRFTRPFALAAIRNTLAFWQRENLGIELTSGIDEVSLALCADAWSRTYRSRVQTFAASATAVESRNGLRLLPEQITANWSPSTRLPPLAQPPAISLDECLRQIASRFGPRTAYLVAMQLEYPAHAIWQD